MARTFKAPWIKDKVRRAQKDAARKFRRGTRYWDIADGNAYKRCYEQWSISDWRWPWRPPEEDFRRNPEYYARWPEFKARHCRRYKMATGNRRAHRPRKTF